MMKEWNGESMKEHAELNETMKKLMKELMNEWWMNERMN